MTEIRPAHEIDIETQYPYSCQVRQHFGKFNVHKNALTRVWSEDGAFIAAFWNPHKFYYFRSNVSVDCLQTGEAASRVECRNTLNGLNHLKLPTCKFIGGFQHFSMTAATLRSARAKAKAERQRKPSSHARVSGNRTNVTNFAASACGHPGRGGRCDDYALLLTFMESKRQAKDRKLCRWAGIANVTRVSAR